MLGQKSDSLSVLLAKKKVNYFAQLKLNKKSHVSFTLTYITIVALVCYVKCLPQSKMLTRVKIAGLVLRAISLIISALKHYKDFTAPMTAFIYQRQRL